MFRIISIIILSNLIIWNSSTFYHASSCTNRLKSAIVNSVIYNREKRTGAALCPAYLIRPVIVMQTENNDGERKRRRRDRA